MFTGKEPAVIFNGLGEIARSIIPVLILFGVIQWTDQQIAAVLLCLGVVLGFLTTMLTRSQTVSTQVAIPKGTADAQIKTALAMDPSASVGDVIRATEADTNK